MNKKYIKKFLNIFILKIFKLMKIWIVMGSDPLYSDEWLDNITSNIPIECVIVQDGFLSIKEYFN